jgi:hypothetical protein
MDEQAWLKSGGARRMIRHLREEHSAARTKVGRRKLLLFEVACFREVWEVLPEPIRGVVERLERLAEGEPAAGLREEVDELFRRHAEPGWGFVSCCLLALRRATSGESIGVSAWRVSTNLASAQSVVAPPFLQTHPQLVQSREAVARRHAALLREIFGNPFRPMPGRKFPAEVRGLAQACYEDPTHYRLLADALADLGEDAAAEHCRQPRHVRGCHVVDWILGKG